MRTAIRCRRCWITSSGLGGGTSAYAGTSQASPTAAGIAALMLEVNPNLTPAQIENLLKTTGTIVTDGKNGLQFPRVNALQAVLANTKVTVEGPGVGVLEVAYSFSAEVIPFATTTPITYVWQATGQTSITYTYPASNTATFTWTGAGPKEILVSVTNGGGTFTDTHTIGIGGAVHQLYLPLVGRDM